MAVFDVTAGGADDRRAMPSWASLAAFYRDAEPDGLPSPPMAAQLETLNARLHTLLAASGRSRLVGIITHNGRRELVMYTSAADEVRAAARALQGEFPDLELQLTLMSDPDWMVFQQFVPEKR